MGLLGDFLEVVFGPDDRYRTVRATIRQWRNMGAVTRERSGTESFGRLKPGQPTTDRIIEEEVLFWKDGADRVRLETTRRWDDRSDSWLVVVNGDQWWRRDSQGHVEVGCKDESRKSNGPIVTGAERHFSPDSVREQLVSLVMSAAGTVRTAGRECVRVRAVPRPGVLLLSRWLTNGADEYEIHGDPERGVMLFVAGKIRGEVIETDEVTEVAFNEPLDPALFTYEPIRGEQVRPADVVVEHLTLAAAVTRMPFTVLVPTKLPDPDHADFKVMYHPPRVGGSWPHLNLMYRGKGHLSVNQSDSQAGYEEYEWETVERGGRVMTISDPGPGAGTRIVRLEQLGTHVAIWSDLDREQLLDLAASLAPASPTKQGNQQCESES